MAKPKKEKVNSKRIASIERYWVLGFAAVVILLTSLPYVLAYATQPSGFTGFLFGVEDGNSYIAKMLLGAQGDWLFRSPYSVTPQHGALLYLPYLLLGKLLGPAVTHLSLVVLFHLFRALAIVALCFATYQFIAFFVERVSLRRLGLALATLGSGLGWVLILVGQANLFGSMPLDFYSPETFGFLAVFSLPHLVLGRALLLWGFLAYLRSIEKPLAPWWTVSIWLGLSLVHLIDAGLGLLLIAIHLAVLWIWQKRQPRKIGAVRPQFIYFAYALIGAAPAFLFNAWVFLRDSYLRQWALRNQILSPNPLHYLVAYGWLLPFVYFGIRYLLRREPRQSSFLPVWLFSLPVLLYLPFGLQRRLSEGAWVMLIALSLIAFEREWSKRKQQLWLFALAVPSTLILLLGSFQAASQPSSPIFVPAEESAAFEELRTVAAPGAIVLAPYRDSNELPAWAPVRVLDGHGPESVGPKKLPKLIHNFFELRVLDDLRLQLLQNYDVSYVLWGPEQANLGKWDPQTAAYLKLLFDFGGYMVFSVTP